MRKNRPLTDAQIKYLAVLHDLDAQGKGVRSIEIVRTLGISRPSAHSMIERLAERGLVQKEYYGVVYLTEEGISEAERCAGIVSGKTDTEVSV